MGGRPSRAEADRAAASTRSECAAIQSGPVRDRGADIVMQPTTGIFLPLDGCQVLPVVAVQPGLRRMRDSPRLEQFLHLGIGELGQKHPDRRAFVQAVTCPDGGRVFQGKELVAQDRSR